MKGSGWRWLLSALAAPGGVEVLVLDSVSAVLAALRLHKVELLIVELRLGEPGPGFVHLSKRLPAEVFDQLTAERLVTRYVKGHARLEWVKPPGRRNEALDCAVYALAGAHMMQIDRWREGDWAKWERRVQTADLFDAPLPAVDAEPASAPVPAAQPAPAAPAAPPKPPATRKTRPRGRFGASGNPWS